MHNENYIISINGGEKERVDLEHLMGYIHNYAEENVTADSGPTTVQVWHEDAPEDMPEFPVVEPLTQFEYLFVHVAELSDPKTYSLDVTRFNKYGLDGWELVSVAAKCLFKRAKRGEPPSG